MIGYYISHVWDRWFASVIELYLASCLSLLRPFATEKWSSEIKNSFDPLDLEAPYCVMI